MIRICCLAIETIGKKAEAGRTVTVPRYLCLEATRQQPENPQGSGR
jgi:hypothetical protein